MLAKHLSKGDRAAAPDLCAAVVRLRQERATVVQRVKFTESSKCTKSADVKRDEMADMEKRLGELDIEIKDKYEQVKSLTDGVVHAVATVLTTSVQHTQGTIDAMDVHIDVARKRAKQQVAIAEKQLKDIEKVQNAKDAASSSHSQTVDVVKKMDTITDKAASPEPDQVEATPSEADQVEAMPSDAPQADAMTAETDQVDATTPETCPAIADALARLGISDRPNMDEPAAELVDKPPMIKCRYCTSYEHANKGSMTRHEKKCGGDSYAPAAKAQKEKKARGAAKTPASKKREREPPVGIAGADIDPNQTR